MTIDYQLHRSDLIAFSNEHRRFASRRASTIYYYGILPVLLLMLASASQSLTVAMIFVLLFLAASWLTAHWNEQEYWRNAYSDENVLVQTLPRQLSLTDDGVKFSCEATEQLYRWRFVKGVVAGRVYVQFVITPLETMHVPVRAFSDSKQLDEFIADAKRHLPS